MAAPLISRASGNLVQKRLSHAPHSLARAASSIYARGAQLCHAVASRRREPAKNAPAPRAQPLKNDMLRIALPRGKGCAPHTTAPRKTTRRADKHRNICAPRDEDITL